MSASDVRKAEEDAWLANQRRLAGLHNDPPGVVRLNQAWIKAHSSRLEWWWAKLTWRPRSPHSGLIRRS